MSNKITDIERWRNEIQMAEEFREKEFGVYSRDKIARAGLNIDYYEKGYALPLVEGTVIDDENITTLNLFHAVVKNVVPNLYYKNPVILTYPKKVESQDTAPIVSQTCNYYFKKMEVEVVNQQVIWDAYVLGYGVCKIGYATKYGMDIEDEKDKKSLADKLLESVGIKKKDVEEVTHPEVNYRIISENPYISYVSPFNFGIDPRATCLEDAMYVYERFRKTVKQMKDNKKYKNTKNLQGTPPENRTHSFDKISQSEQDDFKTVDVYEIHYRSDDGIYILVISKDADEWEEHYHELSIYEFDDWQYELLTFSKHGHKLYPLSDLTKIRPLQNRFNDTVDAILEQVDRFVPKLAYVETDVTPQGKIALQNGDIGATVACLKNPNEIFKELGFTQLKADLVALTERMVDFITIQTGLTKAQLLGVSSGDTATAETIAQGGQTLRISDMTNSVNRFSRRQAMKLWSVIKQFVNLEQLELINGVSGIDQKTGAPLYTWLTIPPNTGVKMRNGDYDFDIEVGSTQKPDLAVIRKQFENLFNILARTDVIALMQQQGKKVDLAELLRLYIQLFPEMVKDVGRIIQNITQQTTGLVDPMMLNGRGGMTPGSGANAMEKQMASPMPSMPSEMGMAR